MAGSCLVDKCRLAKLCLPVEQVAEALHGRSQALQLTFLTWSSWLQGMQLQCARSHASTLSSHPALLLQFVCMPARIGAP